MRRYWRVGWLLVVLPLGGCGAAKFYKTPVANFEKGVNETTTAVEPYFQEMNRIESEYKLYEAVHSHKPLASQDLDPEFSPESIQVRLQALQIIKKYAKNLSDLAGSTAPADFNKAGETLGKESQGLADTVAKLAADKAKVPDIRGPLAALVQFFGQIAIEHQRKVALEKSIQAGEGPVRGLIQSLKQDAIAAAALRLEELAHKKADLLELYNDALKRNASPAEVEPMIQRLLDLQAEVQELSTFPVRGVFDSMESAHNELVAFAKSGGRPSGVAGLTVQIDVFSERAQMFAQLLQSFRTKK